MEYKLYVWNRGILTRYTDGIAIALALSIEDAREIILEKYYKEEVIPYTYLEEEVDNTEWPWYEYEKLKEALEQEPSVYTSSVAIYKQGGD